jgi:inhibitor of KinA
MSVMPGPAWPTYSPVADHALLVSFADAITDAASAAVLALDRALAHAPPVGMVECVPALVNLLIDFDPLITDHAKIRADVENLQQAPLAAQQDRQLHEVEVCYGDEFSPDLAAVAEASRLSTDEVIACHLQGDYRIRMYGFAPGYAYMSGVPRAIQVPRKPSPVRDIAVGSVLIAGPQCLVTTLIMPTGWSIVGRSPTRILSRDQNASFLFGVGDQIRFKRIDRAQYEASKRKGEDG